MSEQNAIKIVVDTNLWISFCIGTNLTNLTDAIINKKVILCFSQELHEEIFAVLERPHLQKFVNQNKIKNLHSLLQNKINYSLPSTLINDCRDPKDNFLLELAISAEADYIVTGDKDLLILNPYRQIKIVRANDFEEILEQSL